jgi:hypothetical protein
MPLLPIYCSIEITSFLSNFPSLGSSNDTSEPFYEHLLDNEVRLHGGFYSKESEVEASLSKRHFDTDYLDRYVLARNLKTLLMGSRCIYSAASLP